MMFHHPDSLWYKTHYQQERNRALAQAQLLNGEAPMQGGLSLREKLLLKGGEWFIQVGTSLRRQVRPAHHGPQMAK